MIRFEVVLHHLHILIGKWNVSLPSRLVLQWYSRIGSVTNLQHRWVLYEIVHIEGVDNPPPPCRAAVRHKSGDVTCRSEAYSYFSR